jgi:hypothetical protein
MNFILSPLGDTFHWIFQYQKAENSCLLQVKNFTTFNCSCDAWILVMMVYYYNIRKNAAPQCLHFPSSMFEPDIDFHKVWYKLCVTDDDHQVTPLISKK